MTCSDEPETRRTTALKDRLRRHWPVRRFNAPERLAIEPVVREIAKRFGGAPRPLPPPRDLLREAEARLIAAGGDFQALTGAQRRRVPWFLWESERCWHENRQLVADFLNWAQDHWRNAPTRLWRHYLLHLDPDTYATERVAGWLREQQHRLPERLRSFSERWSLFEPKTAIKRIAKALILGDEVIQEINALGIDQDDLLRSSFLLHVLEGVGLRLHEGQGQSEIATRLKGLLGTLGETPTYRMQGTDATRRRALKSLVEGLVVWADRLGEPTIDQTLDLLYLLIGDPRLHPARWQGIDETTRRIVEGWLTKKTLDSFFRFMLEMQSDRPDMVEERESFWRGYEKRISRAWLIVGVKRPSEACSGAFLWYLPIWPQSNPIICACCLSAG